EARTAGEAAQDQKGARAGEGATLCVQEELRPVPLVEIGAPVREVAAERLDRVAPDRDDALLVAFTGATDESLLEVDARAVKTDGLAHAEPCAVEQLDQRPVAHHAGRRAGSRLDQPLGLRRRERARELAPPARKLERGGWAVGARAEQDEVLEERAHSGNAPRDRGGREPRGAQFRQPALEIVVSRLRGRAAQPVAERAQVATVRLDGLRRPTRGEQREEALDFGIGSSRIGPRLGHRTFLFRPGRSDACPGWRNFDTKPSQARDDFAHSVSEGGSGGHLSLAGEPLSGSRARMRAVVDLAQVAR